MRFDRAKLMRERYESLLRMSDSQMWKDFGRDCLLELEEMDKQFRPVHDFQVTFGQHDDEQGIQVIVTYNGLERKVARLKMSGGGR